MERFIRIKRTEIKEFINPSFVYYVEWLLSLILTVVVC